MLDIFFVPHTRTDLGQWTDRDTGVNHELRLPQLTISSQPLGFVRTFVAELKSSRSSRAALALFS